MGRITPSSASEAVAMFSSGEEALNSDCTLADAAAAVSGPSRTERRRMTRQYVTEYRNPPLPPRGPTSRRGGRKFEWAGSTARPLHRRSNGWRLAKNTKSGGRSAGLGYCTSGERCRAPGMQSASECPV
jgi:hypothetical protein